MVIRAGLFSTAIVAGLATAAPALAKVGLNVDPGQLLIQGITPGETYYIKDATGEEFTIKNTGSARGTYSLSVKKPTEAGMKCFQGYRDIPDPSWIWFEEKKGGKKIDQAVVPGGGETTIPMAVKIPAGKKYYNRNWEAALLVEGGSGGTFSLAVSPKYQIETESRRGYEMKDAPEGTYLAPSVVLFESVKPGAPAGDGLVFFNNTEKKHTYKITALSPPEEVEGMFIPWSRGYERIPTATWVVPGVEGETKHPRTKKGKPITPLKEISLEPGTRAEIGLALEIPEDEWKPDQRWEGFLFVISDDESIDFARIRVHTAPAEEEKE